MKLLERLFYEPKHEKVTDEALTRSIITSVIGILFCMTCLFGLTWAWFSSSIVTGVNKITAANFDLDVTVTEKDTENKIEPDGDGFYILDAQKKYTVTLAKTEIATAKRGFCLLTVYGGSDTSNATPYYTNSIPKINSDTKTETSPYVFSVWGVSKIKFTPMWGKHPDEQSEKRVPDGGSLFLSTVSYTAPDKAQQTDITVNEKEKSEPDLSSVQTENTKDTTVSSAQQTPQTDEENSSVTDSMENKADTTDIPENNGTEETQTEKPSDNITIENTTENIE